MLDDTSTRVFYRLNPKHDDISMLKGRAYITMRHRRNCSEVLLQYRVPGSATLANITLRAPLQANRVLRVDEYLGSQQFTKLGPVQGEQSFDDYDFRWMKALSSAGPRVRREVVYRKIDGFPAFQCRDLANQ